MKLPQLLCPHKPTSKKQECLQTGKEKKRARTMSRWPLALAVVRPQRLVASSSVIRFVQNLSTLPFSPFQCGVWHHVPCLEDPQVDLEHLPGDTDLWACPACADKGFSYPWQSGFYDYQSDDSVHRLTSEQALKALTDRQVASFYATFPSFPRPSRMDTQRKNLQKWVNTAKEEKPYCLLLTAQLKRQCGAALKSKWKKDDMIRYLAYGDEAQRPNVPLPDRILQRLVQSAFLSPLRGKAQKSANIGKANEQPLLRRPCRAVNFDPESRWRIIEIVNVGIPRKRKHTHTHIPCTCHFQMFDLLFCIHQLVSHWERSRLLDFRGIETLNQIAAHNHTLSASKQRGERERGARARAGEEREGRDGYFVSVCN